MALIRQPLEPELLLFIAAQTETSPKVIKAGAALDSGRNCLTNESPKDEIPILTGFPADDSDEDEEEVEAGGMTTSTLLGLFKLKSSKSVEGILNSIFESNDIELDSLKLSKTRSTFCWPGIKFASIIF